MWWPLPRSDHYLVEMLEEEREHVSAQLAFALADYDEHVGRPTSTTS